MKQNSTRAEEFVRRFLTEKIYTKDGMVKSRLIDMCNGRFLRVSTRPNCEAGPFVVEYYKLEEKEGMPPQLAAYVPEEYPGTASFQGLVKLMREVAKITRDKESREHFLLPRDAFGINSVSYYEVQNFIQPPEPKNRFRLFRTGSPFRCSDQFTA